MRLARAQRSFRFFLSSFFSLLSSPRGPPLQCRKGLLVRCVVVLRHVFQCLDAPKRETGLCSSLETVGIAKPRARVPRSRAVYMAHSELRGDDCGPGRGCFDFFFLFPFFFFSFSFFLSRFLFTKRQSVFASGFPLVCCPRGSSSSVLLFFSRFLHLLSRLTPCLLRSKDGDENEGR